MKKNDLEVHKQDNVDIHTKYPSIRLENQHSLVHESEMIRAI